MTHENNLPVVNLRLALLIAVIALLNNSLISQNNNDYSVNPVAIANELYGTSDKLVNGVVYNPPHPKANGVPYYPYSDYHAGKIFIGGDEFINEQIKYNIELQRLVLNKEINNGAELEVLLFNSRIDSFSFDNRVFINRSYIADSLTEEGFYEVIRRGEHTYLSYHKIFFNNDYDRKNPFGKYHTPNTKYYRMEGNKLIKFSNKRQFAEFFAPRQKEIRRYMRKNKIKFRKMNSGELQNLIRYSEELD